VFSGGTIVDAFVDSCMVVGSTLGGIFDAGGPSVGLVEFAVGPSPSRVVVEPDGASEGFGSEAGGPLGGIDGSTFVEVDELVVVETAGGEIVGVGVVDVGVIEVDVDVDVDDGAS
jgi:hypothetical protein